MSRPVVTCFRDNVQEERPEVVLAVSRLVPPVEAAAKIGIPVVTGRGRVGRGIGSTLATNLANMALGIVTGVATARGLQPEARGVFLGVLTWTSTISTFALVGLHDAIVYEARGSTNAAFTLIRKLAPRSYLQALVAFVILLPINLYITGFSNPLVTAAAVSAGLVIASNVFVLLRLSALRSIERYTTWNLIRLVPQSMHACVVILLVFTDSLTIATGLFSLVAGNLATAAVTGIVCRRVSWIAVDVNTASAQRFGRSLLAVNLPMFLSQKTDQLLIALVAPPQVLGVYAVAVTMSGLLLTVGTTFEQVLFPRLVAGTIDADATRKVLALALVVSTTGAVAMALIARPLIAFVYGNEYVAAADAFLLLAPGVVCLVAAQVLTSKLKSSNRFKPLFAAYSTGSVIIAASLPILTAKYGLPGAAAATAVGYVATFLVLCLAQRGSRGTESSGAAS